MVLPLPPYQRPLLNHPRSSQLYPILCPYMSPGLGVLHLLATHLFLTFLVSSFPALPCHQAHLPPSSGHTLCPQGMYTQSVVRTPLVVSVRHSAPHSPCLSTSLTFPVIPSPPWRPWFIDVSPQPHPPSARGACVVCVQCSLYRSWIRAALLRYDLTLTNYLERPNFPNKVHSEVPGVRTSTC